MLSINKMFKVFPTLETEDYLLREITQEDQGDLFQIYRDPEVMRYEGMIPLNDISQVQLYIKAMQEGYRDKKSLRWGIEDKKTKQLIGFISIYYINRIQKSAFIGYCFNSNEWGKGIATLCLNEVLSYLKKEARLFVIIATIWPENIRSKLLVERLGFIKGDVIPKSGFNELTKEEIDMEAYALSLLFFKKKIITFN
ncbi:MAG: GNAT family N-acetyltransferase [Erysipelotrichaceae bacterium]